LQTLRNAISSVRRVVKYLLGLLAAIGAIAEGPEWIAKMLDQSWLEPIKPYMQSDIGEYIARFLLVALAMYLAYKIGRGNTVAEVSRVYDDNGVDKLFQSIRSSFNQPGSFQMRGKVLVDGCMKSYSFNSKEETQRD
jgi:hypothetical protein